MPSFLALFALLPLALQSAQNATPTISPSTSQTPPKVTDVIDPMDSRVVYTVQGKGVQIYVCTNPGPGMQWVLGQPAATLTDASGQEVGKHGYGPQWTWKDGSAVMGTVIGKRPSPDAGSVPWLLLSAAPMPGLSNPGGQPVEQEKAGALDAITFVKRSDTHGGVGPTSGCEPSKIGDSVEVPYTATYTFYTHQY